MNYDQRNHENSTGNRTNSLQNQMQVGNVSKVQYVRKQQISKQLDSLRLRWLSLHRHSPRYLGQATAKRPFGLPVNLPPASGLPHSVEASHCSSLKWNVKKGSSEHQFFWSLVWSDGKKSRLNPNGVFAIKTACFLTFDETVICKPIY